MVNVLHHVHARHKNKKVPRIKPICEAAAQRNEEIENNVNQNLLLLHDGSDGEPDIDHTKDTGKKQR